MTHHPKKIDDKTSEYKNWSIFEDIGSLSNFNCCTERKIHQVNRSIGLGPSLFLISLKAYIKLFAVLSLLALPSVVVLMSGNQVSDMGLDDGSLFAILSKASLGNIGYMGKKSCQYTNLASHPKSLDLHCPTGVLSSLTAVGLNAELN